MVFCCGAVRTDCCCLFLNIIWTEQISGSLSSCVLWNCERLSWFQHLCLLHSFFIRSRRCRLPWPDSLKNRRPGPFILFLASAFSPTVHRLRWSIHSRRKSSLISQYVCRGGEGIKNGRFVSSAIQTHQAPQRGLNPPPSNHGQTAAMRTHPRSSTGSPSTIHSFCRSNRMRCVCDGGRSERADNALDIIEILADRVPYVWQTSSALSVNGRVCVAGGMREYWCESLWKNERVLLWTLIESGVFMDILDQNTEPLCLFSGGQRSIDGRWGIVCLWGEKLLSVFS